MRDMNFSSLATASAQQCSTCYGRDGTIASRSINREGGTAALVLIRKEKAIVGPGNFQNRIDVRSHSCCHIVRPATCIGSWLYWTYLLGLIKEAVFSRTTSYSTICCPKWSGRTRLFRIGKRQKLASAMQLNERYSWRYRKVKFLCAISFLLLL